MRCTVSKGSIFFISFIVLSVLVIASTYTISYVQKQDHIEIGESSLAELTGLDITYRSYPNLEKYDKAFWFQDEYKNDYELDINTLAFQKYRYAGKTQSPLIITNGSIEDNIIYTARNICPDFFDAAYSISSENLDADQVTKGFETEEIVYLSQTADDASSLTFEFIILDGEIYQITLSSNN